MGLSLLGDRMSDVELKGLEFDPRLGKNVPKGTEAGTIHCWEKINSAMPKVT